MAETRERFDRYFREGAVRLARLRRENAERAIGRDGLKRSVALW